MIRCLIGMFAASLLTLSSLEGPWIDFVSSLIEILAHYAEF